MPTCLTTCHVNDVFPPPHPRWHPEAPHLQDNEGEDEKEMHTPDEVLVDPNHPQVAGPVAQGVDPAVDGLNEDGQTPERATVC